MLARRLAPKTRPASASVTPSLTRPESHQHRHHGADLADTRGDVTNDARSVNQAGETWDKGAVGVLIPVTCSPPSLRPCFARDRPSLGGERRPSDPAA